MLDNSFSHPLCTLCTNRFFPYTQFSYAAFYSHSGKFLREKIKGRNTVPGKMLTLACLLKSASNIRKGLTIGHQMLQFLLLLKITRMLKERGCRVCIYTIARKVDRKDLSFATFLFFSDNYKSEIKSMTYFDIDLNNLIVPL